MPLASFYGGEIMNFSQDSPHLPITIVPNQTLAFTSDGTKYCIQYIQVKYLYGKLLR